LEIELKVAMQKQDENKGHGSPEESSDAYHRPVLLMEAVDALQVSPDGVYVDCTFGGGGHSGEILKRLDKGGRLFAFDQDSDALKNAVSDLRFVFVPHNFRHLSRFLRLHKVGQVDGILADLGVSSHQFDEAGRGFSTRFESEMDMRMDRRQEKTAFDVVNQYPELQLQKIFEQYGEVTNARTLAKRIVEIRRNSSLKTTANFKQALYPVVKGNPHKYFAQVFQALRIEVNDELAALKELLEQARGLLRPGGRIAIITFHSLEDRIVKIFLRKGDFEETQPVNPFAQTSTVPAFRLITKKPVTPGGKEMKENPRSRSAKLRVAEKL
jgi:16S rRNA (cytosine1402-N4)-methyltransferase